MQIKTAGDLRGFLADVLAGVYDGTVDTSKAHAICKVAAQINQSLAVEVTASLQMQKMGGDSPAAGSMVIGRADSFPETILIEELPAKFSHPPQVPKPAVNGKIWCEQCELQVKVNEAVSCKSQFCKARESL